MTTRGIRNNNPGNLRHSRNQWQGLATRQDDSDFCTFTSLSWGIRALIVTLKTYHNKYGLSTVREIISRWAPTNENNTDAYVRSVATALGRDADEPLDLNGNPQLYLALAKAIARHENGTDAKSIPEESWDSGARLAGIEV